MLKRNIVMVEAHRKRISVDIYDLPTICHNYYSSDVSKLGVSEVLLGVTSSAIRSVVVC